jgi:hypothetical protein
MMSDPGEVTESRVDLWGSLGFETYLLVKLDFAVQVLLCEGGKVLGLLRVVDVHLGHRRVQDGFASQSDVLVGLLRRAIDWMSS